VQRPVFALPKGRLSPVDAFICGGSGSKVVRVCRQGAEWANAQLLSADAVSSDSPVIVPTYFAALRQGVRATGVTSVISGRAATSARRWRSRTRIYCACRKVASSLTGRCCRAERRAAELIAYFGQKQQGTHDGKGSMQLFAGRFAGGTSTHCCAGLSLDVSESLSFC